MQEVSQRLKENSVLIFHQNMSFFSPDSATVKTLVPDVQRPTTQTLKESIEQHQLFEIPVYGERFRIQERRTLAGKLALHLSIFCPWRHTSIPWESTSIHFVLLSRNKIDRTSPYISWQLGHDSATELSAPWHVEDEADSIDKEAAEISDDAREASLDALSRAFTSFAKLLLEVEYGSMSHTGFSLDDEDLRNSVRAYHDALQQDADPVTHGRYLQAVDACLRFHLIFQKARLYQELSQRVEGPETPEDTYRRLVRNEILPNLVVEVSGIQRFSETRRRTNSWVIDNDDSSSDSDFEVIDDDEVPRYHDHPPQRPTVPTTEHIAKFAQSLWSRWRDTTTTNSPRDGLETPRSLEWTSPSSGIYKGYQGTPRHNDTDPLKIGQMYPLLTLKAVSFACPDSTLKDPVPGPPSNVEFVATESSKTLDEELADIILSLSDSAGGSLLDEETYSSSLEAQCVLDTQLSSFCVLMALYRQKQTDKWFNNFLKLLKVFKTGRASGGRLKVAILDSGINYTHSDFDSEDKERIKERKSFIDEEADVDHVGHGTHIATIVLRLTENVDLYIGKVTNSKDAPQRNNLLKVGLYHTSQGYTSMTALTSGRQFSTQERLGKST
ncbi:hypothetical protein N0V83_005805 [Neocucurbitaria cava]|uniref:Peptidase S8/S53 domain-containing protein n=1 Tax=Neocucurbitaria cava TaxID=798079 RepID=A0A9W8Y8I9_9PLEO|nr:hypothetical protein N0V83_005805 [Neocucurbitaria cava]